MTAAMSPAITINTQSIVSLILYIKNKKTYALYANKQKNRKARSEWSTDPLNFETGVKKVIPRL